MSLSDEAKLAVLDDLLQETDGLWAVLGSSDNSYDDQWVTAVCTSEEAATEMIQRCMDWSRRMALFLKNRGYITGFEFLLSTCPDVSFPDLHSPNLTLIAFSALKWRKVHLKAMFAPGTFVRQNPNPIQEVGQVISSSSSPPSVWTDEVHTVLTYRDKESGTETSVYSNQRTSDDADAWIIAMTAFLEGRDPLDALEKARDE